MQVKVRLQTAPEGAYTGAMDVTRKLMAKDGITGYVDEAKQKKRRIGPKFDAVILQLLPRDVFPARYAAICSQGLHH